MWFKVDDKLHGHRKPRAAGKAAMGVWVLAGSWAADHLTDGFVPAACLPLWGTRGDAKRLVDAGLWSPHTTEHGEKGWLFHNWADFQPSAQAVEADRAKARERMKRMRSGERSPEQGAHVPENFDRSSATPSRPVPSRPSGVTGPSRLTVVPGLSDDDLDRIATATRGDRDHAVVTAANILDRAGAQVARPAAYVLRAIGDDPARYRAARRHTKDTCCPEPGHDSYPADNCGACRSEQLAGGA